MDVKTRFMITTPPSEPAGYVRASDAGTLALTIVDQCARSCAISHSAFTIEFPHRVGLARARLLSG
jgi:hypothetical protein